MGLENEANLAAQFRQGGLLGVQQFGPKDAQAATLGSAQAPQHGQQGCFSGSRGTGEDHNLTREYRQADVMEHGLALPRILEGVIQVENLNQRGIGASLRRCNNGGAHQKISAGSSWRSLPVASQPEPLHMARVNRNTSTARWVDICTIKEVELARKP